MNVLLVDDEPIILRGLQKLINWSALDMVVSHTATNAAQAMLCVRRGKIDILIADISMEGMSGLEMLREMNAAGCLVQTAVIILSGYREFEYAQEAINSGVMSYLTKPVSPDELVRVLKMAQRRIQQLKQVQPLDEPNGVGAQGDDVVAQAIHYIHYNYSTSLSLKKMADRFFISPNYFCVVFKRVSGKNYHEYVNGVRMEAAKRMLETGNVKVFEVADRVGFKNARYFSESFKKYYSISPSEVSLRP